jgi:hypothetical protein
MRHVVVALAAAALLAGCTSSGVRTEARPIASRYSGPMYVPVSQPATGPVLYRSGAAARALECDGAPYDGGGAKYDSGLATVQRSAEDALENLLKEDAPSIALPTGGYRVERKDGARVLFSYDVGERTKIAFIAADGMRDFNKDEGWGVEAWAQCDPAELPAGVTDTFGIGVWQDQSGARVPVTKIQSFQGAQHCDWQDITFLLLGPESNSHQYLRDTSGELARYLRTTYDGHAHLPQAATDTGYHRDGRELWLGPRNDAAYLVSLDDTKVVERWPAAKKSISCA